MQMDQVEFGCVRGHITIHYYRYDKNKDRTFINTSATVYWIKDPTFQMTDYVTLEVKSSESSFAKLNTSSSACYKSLSDQSMWFVYDIFQQEYESFGKIRYTLPMRLHCEDKKEGILYSVTMIYHGMTTGRASLIEITANYEHQALKPTTNFSMIGALTTLGSNLPIEILPTLTLSGEFKEEEIWKKVRLAELIEEGYNTEISDVQRFESYSDSDFGSDTNGSTGSFLGIISGR